MFLTNFCLFVDLSKHRFLQDYLLLFIHLFSNLGHNLENNLAMAKCSFFSFRSPTSQPVISCQHAQIELDGCSLETNLEAPEGGRFGDSVSRKVPIELAPNRCFQAMLDVLC